jgi:hypothetical protein
MKAKPTHRAITNAKLAVLREAKARIGRIPSLRFPTRRLDEAACAQNGMNYRARKVLLEMIEELERGTKQ